MNMNVPLIAGGISTIIYASGVLPMVIKAGRTKDLRSYSLGNILLANVGNVINSVYIFNLPTGPIWILHSFYIVTTALMLVWYLRYTSHSTPVLTTPLPTAASWNSPVTTQRPAPLRGSSQASDLG